ncbi:hypothetical protein [uncultured Campylobacter sp.]|uniref:hypothetical protein n=1 Tax=uncultured Campylobacter sp. TaxID=218934 RepID=UPI00260B790A|nr:hypothetical protein [uncultured Campylobacter sp.]
MKNFIVFAVLAALLGGCASKKDQNGIADSEDIAMLSFDKNISTRYRAHNGKLYKNGKVLGKYLTAPGLGMQIYMDEMGNGYIDPSAIKEHNSKKITEIIFVPNEFIKVISYSHNDGVCKALSTGKYVHIKEYITIYSRGEPIVAYSYDVLMSRKGMGKISSRYDFVNKKLSYVDKKILEKLNSTVADHVQASVVLSGATLLGLLCREKSKRLD